MHRPSNIRGNRPMWGVLLQSCKLSFTVLLLHVPSYSMDILSSQPLSPKPTDHQHCWHDGNVLVYLQAFEQHILSSMGHLKLMRARCWSKRVWLLDYWTRWKCAQTDEQMMHILLLYSSEISTLHHVKTIVKLGLYPSCMEWDFDNNTSKYSTSQSNIYCLYF